jgi:hypothetical protein
LAQAVGNAFETAYRWGAALATAALMTAWAGYCDGAEVINFPVDVRSA